MTRCKNTREIDIALHSISFYRMRLRFQQYYFCYGFPYCSTNNNISFQPFMSFKDFINGLKMLELNFPSTTNRKSSSSCYGWMLYVFPGNGYAFGVQFPFVYAEVGKNQNCINSTGNKTGSSKCGKLNDQSWNEKYVGNTFSPFIPLYDAGKR